MADKMINLKQLLLQSGPGLEWTESGIDVKCREHVTDLFLKIPPEFWEMDERTPFRFLTLDVCHEQAEVVRVAFELNQPEVESGIAVEFGVLPGVRTRLSFPLERVDAERLFLPRVPGGLQVVAHGGSGLSLRDIDQMTIRIVAMDDRGSIQLSNCGLWIDEPTSIADVHSVVDSLGQLRTRDWSGKIKDEARLNSLLREERIKVGESKVVDDWDRFGGWKLRSWEATGFFRTQYDGTRWWIVDPDGNAFISVGFDCVNAGEATWLPGMEHLLDSIPPREYPWEPAWTSNGTGFSFPVSNLLRAFGSEWWQAWREITEGRIRGWKLNTIGAWSDERFVKEAGLPYVTVLRGFPDTSSRIFRDFPDVFHEEYEKACEAYALQLERLRDDVHLIGYFLRNEPQWAFVPAVSLATKMLESPGHLASKATFREFLHNKYGTHIDSLNAAWHTQFESYKALLRGVSVSRQWSSEMRQDLREFTRRLIVRYVEMPARAAKAADPHHLNLGMRYAWISSEDLLWATREFDVFSLNMYQMQPDRNVIEKINRITGLPVIIGEFHHGALDAGLPMPGLRRVASQKDRGLAYRQYVEQGVAMPGVVGMHYFQWNDQPALGRFDGENYQIGAVDTCHQPYDVFVESVRETNRDVYSVASGERRPLDLGVVELPR